MYRLEGPDLAMAAALVLLALATAGLGTGLGPVVMAASLSSAAASLAGLILGLASAFDDREGWAAAYIAAMGRRRYALWRTATTSLKAALVLAPATALYAAARPGGAAAYATAVVLSAYSSLYMGLLIGFSAKSRGYGYAWGVSLWTALALVYDLALTFATTYLPIPTEAVAGALLLNPVTAARLAGVAQADPHLLTLGPVGDLLYSSAFVIPVAAATWLAALLATAVIKIATTDL
ncbi:hypothetical protein P186_0755 [Pyrobaculum ferrireducens]|uniref:Uncharacterized protein n=2 Tax=Pyrobaculum ferrireducens TaxID=1104324 RepID=G7VIA9_9CREN|nr:hypothetical protein P186_0755 [Pyrobaculum ferrireducens]